MNNKIMNRATEIPGVKELLTVGRFVANFESSSAWRSARKLALSLSRTRGGYVDSRCGVAAVFVHLSGFPSYFPEPSASLLSPLRSLVRSLTPHYCVHEEMKNGCLYKVRLRSFFICSSCNTATCTIDFAVEISWDECEKTSSRTGKFPEKPISLTMTA